MVSWPLAKRIKLAAHLAVEELARRRRAAGANGLTRGRWQMLWLLARGEPSGTVAALCGYHVESVRRLARAYNREGPAVATLDKRRQARGRPALLDGAGQGELTRMVEAGHDGAGQLWDGPRAAAFIAARLGRAKVSRKCGWATLRRLGFSPQAPRPRHEKSSDAAAQEQFKRGA